MSWGGLKKSFNRAGTQLMQRTGQLERSDDSRFKEEETKYREFEKHATTLLKYSRDYLDSIRLMSASEARIGDTIEGFFHDNSQTATIASSYKRALEELDARTAKELDGPYRATVLDPMGKLCSYFPEVNKLIEKRGRKLLDYDASRSRYKKQSERPADDPSKLPRMEREHNEAKLVFEAINEQLMIELPQLVDMRIPYLDPSLEMMIRIQIKFAQEGYEQLGGVQRYFPEQVRSDYAEGQLDAQVEGVLQEMRGLSICGLGQ
ncbi:Similar to S.cerevisiae protein RVS161 (Amphiphysin-like lipid raft protein) [Malassezia sympodialis ATCC 42132]|uniref:Similar to S.cerevisiae protein RVS161 (Amphiphysin-like lipid raft protein) n=1 Tax=Malassezia sympodialis (strain ATCC 42132) TaxID=1230383 RepID=A0A1M8A6P6_MALS4|nr:Similar to S.cerevisiae protein RVS161 (Amphiphysin-like lipid raft protein) [Malassezia sympodialis ATCC 42132]